jgi:hypothetical protein
MPAKPMSESQRMKWRTAARARQAKPLSKGCTHCGALPGHFCRTKNGKEITNLGQIHNARLGGSNRRYGFTY